MLIWTALAVACGVSGLYLSYYAGLAAGASIAGSIVVLYVVVASVTGILGRLVPRNVGAAGRGGEEARA